MPEDDQLSDDLGPGYTPKVNKEGHHPGHTTLKQIADPSVTGNYYSAITNHAGRAWGGPAQHLVVYHDVPSAHLVYPKGFPGTKMGFPDFEPVDYNEAMYKYGPQLEANTYGHPGTRSMKNSAANRLATKISEEYKDLFIAPDVEGGLKSDASNQNNSVQKSLGREDLTVPASAVQEIRGEDFETPDPGDNIVAGTLKDENPKFNAGDKVYYGPNPSEENLHTVHGAEVDPVTGKLQYLIKPDKTKTPLDQGTYASEVELSPYQPKKATGEEFNSEELDGYDKYNVGDKVYYGTPSAKVGGDVHTVVKVHPGNRYTIRPDNNPNPNYLGIPDVAPWELKGIPRKDMTSAGDAGAGFDHFDSQPQVEETPQAQHAEDVHREGNIMRSFPLPRAQHEQAAQLLKQNGMNARPSQATDMLEVEMPFDANDDSHPAVQQVNSLLSQLGKQQQPLNTGQPTPDEMIDPTGWGRKPKAATYQDVNNEIANQVVGRPYAANNIPINEALDSAEAVEAHVKKVAASFRIPANEVGTILATKKLDTAQIQAWRNEGYKSDMIAALATEAAWEIDSSKQSVFAKSGLIPNPEWMKTASAEVENAVKTDATKVKASDALIVDTMVASIINGGHVEEVVDSMNLSATRLYCMSKVATKNNLPMLAAVMIAKAQDQIKAGNIKDNTGKIASSIPEVQPFFRMAKIVRPVAIQLAAKEGHLIGLRGAALAEYVASKTGMDRQAIAIFASRWQRNLVKAHSGLTADEHRIITDLTASFMRKGSKGDTLVSNVVASANRLIDVPRATIEAAVQDMVDEPKAVEFEEITGYGLTQPEVRTGAVSGADGAMAEYYKNQSLKKPPQGPSQPTPTKGEIRPPGGPLSAPLNRNRHGTSES